MDITIQGNARKNYKPNQIKLSFTFNEKQKTYEDVLDCGLQKVKQYLDLLVSFGFNKEDMKTDTFRVSENKEYNEAKKTYVLNGYQFTQLATVEMDFDMTKLSTIMEATSKLKNGPSYRVDFQLKQDDKIEEEMLELAYKDAERQAKAIAKAAGKVVKTCAKTSFEPFEANLSSHTQYSGYNHDMQIAKKASISETIQKVFIPQDVVVDETIYCLFIAE